MKVHFLVLIRRRAVDTPCAFPCLPLWEKRDGFDEETLSGMLDRDRFRPSKNIQKIAEFHVHRQRHVGRPTCLAATCAEGTRYRVPCTPTGPVYSQIAPQVLELVCISITAPSAVPGTAEFWTRRIFSRRVHTVQLYNWGLSPAVNILGAKRFPVPVGLFKPPLRFESHDGYRDGDSCAHF